MQDFAPHDGNNKESKPFADLVRQRFEDIERLKKDTETKLVEQSGDGLNPTLMYVKVYVGLVEYFKLTAAESLLICTIWSLQRKTGWCYASQKKLALASRVSITSVNTLLRKLEKRGLLESGHKNEHGVIQRRLGPEAVDKARYITSSVERDNAEKHGER